MEEITNKKFFTVNLNRSKLFIVSLALLLLTIFGCSSSPSNGNNGTPSSSGGASPTNSVAGSISTSDKPQDVLIKSVKALIAAKSFRARSETTHPAASTQNAVFEYVAPDRFHMSIDSNVVGRASKSEYIIIGKDSWMNRNGQGWTKAPMDMSEAISSIHNPKLLDEASKTNNIKLIGPETVDGIPTIVYQYDIPTSDNSNLHLTGKSWITVSNGMLHKLEVDDPDNKMTTIATYTDYNTPITIEPPVK